MSVSNRIKHIRIAKGLTQQIIANRLHITQSAYCKIEKKANSCSFKTLQKIAQVLSVSIIDLIDTDSL